MNQEKKSLLIKLIMAFAGLLLLVGGVVIYFKIKYNDADDDKPLKRIHSGKTTTIYIKPGEGTP